MGPWDPPASLVVVTSLGSDGSVSLGCHGLSPIGKQGRRVRDSRDHRASRVSADRVDRWGVQRESVSRVTFVIKSSELAVVAFPCGYTPFSLDCLQLQLDLLTELNLAW
jgi:hypothetical protein